MNYLDIFDRSDIDRHLSNWVPVDERSGVNGEVRHINPAHVTNLAPPPEDPKPKKLAEARPIVYKEKAKPKAPKVISAESLRLFTHCPDGKPHEYVARGIRRAECCLCKRSTSLRLIPADVTIHERKEWRKARVPNPPRKPGAKNPGPDRGLLPLASDPRLHEYERETIKLMWQKKSNTDIAKILGISHHTVNNRIKVIRKRLGIYGKWSTL